MMMCNMERTLHYSDCMDFTSDFIPKAPFGSRHDAVNWVQRQGCNRRFVIVMKNSDVGGDGRRRGRVNMACERLGLIGALFKELGK
ncbi:hypothetical protein Sjap_020380 [Stephania japonica]|uniref:Uncharacterized protein n=1 Tax=Stephania japonica TaxID=461633 RepID=A0AAP0I084_9MAGN